MNKIKHFIRGITANNRIDLDAHSLSSTQPDISGMLQEFFHYMGHIWIQHYNPPQTAEALAKFRIREVIDAYKVYRTSGGTIPIDEGLDLEMTYLVTQMVARKPLICLLNREKEDISITRMARVRQLPPKEIIEFLQQSYPVTLNTCKGITSQVKHLGQLGPMYTTLVHDGNIGHCIVLIGMERGSNRLILWDPWPLRSLLCYENNAVGVAAEPVLNEESYWTVDIEEMMRVLYAIFVHV